MKRSDAQTGQGYPHLVGGHELTATPTMSSLAMVDYINAERKAKAESLVSSLGQLSLSLPGESD
ncbi:TPA: hypothetical protein MPK85_005317 [Salmonella enterica]|nr:hypothetical protein [Salmonella enterica]